MKTFSRIIALVLVFLMLFTASCNTPGSSSSSSSDDVNPPETPSTTYNIIFALATIPPVLAALDCIDSGYQTYAIIERGKTYNGIDMLENFHNAGFDKNSNLSNGFTSTEFNAMVDQIKAIKANDSTAYFNIYVQDGTALRGAAVAANAGLTKEDFHIYMCEDGTGAYIALYDMYMKDKTVSASSDQVYDGYAAIANEKKAVFENIMSKTNNQNEDADLKYDIGAAFALASLDNFTYYIQDESAIVDILSDTGDVKTKLLSAFGVDGYNAETELKLNLKYQKISEGISKLTEAEKTDYLTLMYGDFYEDTYEALTRTERADKNAPSNKLVFIGSRHGDYPKFASNEKYGIGGLAAGEKVPATYAELNDKYKTALLFPTESDYTSFLSVLNNNDNFSADATDEIKDLARAACFNLYIDYIFSLKFTYSIYGEDYDIIMKGHPREAIGSYEEWNDRYKVTYGNNQTYVYDKLVDNALLSFHANDSTGKYIGMVPYGTSAENLAYLGANISIAGLPSSTYSGYDTAVDVLFILAESDQDIAGSGSDTVDSQIKARYDAGNLLFTDKNGEKQTSVYYNIGNVLKSTAEIYKALDQKTTEEKYTALFNAWLNAIHNESTDIDKQGFGVKN